MKISVKKQNDRLGGCYLNCSVLLLVTFRWQNEIDFIFEVFFNIIFIESETKFACFYFNTQ